MMRRVKIFALLMVIALWALAKLCLGATYNVNNTMSTSTIAGVIASAAAAGGGNTVQFAAGVYSMTSQIALPCPASALTITGPIVAYPGPYTVNLNGPVPGNTAFSVGPCSTATTFQYLNWNGGEPSAGGGGFLYVAEGTSNVSVQYSYIHGNQASTASAHNYDSLIWLDGNGGTDSNITIQWDIFGHSNDGTPTNADCGAIATLFVYQGSDYGNGGGGYCAAVGVHTATSNLIINNNVIQYQEQGLKFFSPPGGSTWLQSNDSVQYNDYSFIHRIYTESQQTASPTCFCSNVTSSPVNPSFGTWQFSLPQGNQNNSNDNVMIEETTASSGSPGSYEFWGFGTADHNLVQGYQGASMQYGFGGAPWSMSNNIIQNLSGGGFINNEENITANFPTMTGDVETRSLASVQSTAPSISPPSGAYTSPPTITLSDAGNTSGAGPRGNTSVWYTTDGSTPVPGAGTARFYGGPFLVTLPVTIKAVGMWGALNQRTSYPAGYGFTPSSVVSASYTSTGGVVLSSVALSNVGSIHTLNTGAMLQFTATCTYSDGSTTNCNTVDTHGNVVSLWNSSASGVVSINGSGLVTGVAPGTANITATVAGIVSNPPWAMTVSTPTASLSSVTLAATGGISSIPVAGVNQLLATCLYSDSSSDSCGSTDVHGNVVNLWTSSAPTVATVSSSGVVTGVGAGSTNLRASVTPGAVSSQWGQPGADSPGVTYANFINSTYVVLGSQAGGYSGGSCYFYLPTGTLTNGALYDCGLIPAPTPATQGSAWQCWYTYTVTSTSSPGAFVGGPMNSCGTLAPGSTWWVGSTSNAPGPSPAGFSSCGGNPCNGTAPTAAGAGTYPFYTIAVPYGTRTGMPSAMAATGATVQASQYVTLGQPPILSNTVTMTVAAAAPTLVSAYLGTPGSANTMIVGGTLQFSAHCVYSDSTTTDCTVADVHGNAVTQWITSDATKVTIGAVGSGNAGLATAIAAGTLSIQAKVGAITSSSWGLTISNVTVSLTGLSIAPTGGVTGLFVGSTNHLIATCLYSDSSTTNCTSTDSHGNKAGSYTSSSTSHATVVSTTGVVTGIAPGSTNLQASAGGLNSNTVPLTVLAVPNGTYTITIYGPVKFSGTVQF